MTKEQKLEIIDVVRPLLHALGVEEFVMVEREASIFLSPKSVGFIALAPDFDIHFFITFTGGFLSSAKVWWAVGLVSKGSGEEITKTVLLGDFEDLERALKYQNMNVVIAATKRYLPKVQDELVEEIKRARDDRRATE